MTHSLNHFSALASAVLAVSLGAAALAPTSAHAAEGDAFDGFHIGVEAGWEDRAINGNVPTDTTAVTLQDKADDFSWAVNVGYDHRFDRIVIGVEAGLSPDVAKLSAPIANAGTLEIDPKWRLDLSARAGVVVAPRLLAYGRVGYTMERSRISGLVDGQSVPLASEKTTIDGISFGGGLEYGLSQGLALRAEYRRTELDGAMSADRILGGVSVRF